MTRTRRRILIVRLSAIGDIVFASPLVAALRRAYPRGPHRLAGAAGCRATAGAAPGLGRGHRLAADASGGTCGGAGAGGTWPGRSGDSGRGCAQRRFDLALDLQGLLKSGVLTWLSGARERVGLGSREGSQWLMTRTIPRGGEPKRIGSEYLYLAQTPGAAD